MSDTAPLLAVLERIAKAIEDGNALRRRETMKAEPGEQPMKEYLGQGKEPTHDKQASGRVRRPQAASRS